MNGYAPEYVRNGSYPKKIQTEHGESVISIPRDRNGQFEPIAVPKHESRGLSIEKLVISLYAKVMSVSDIEEEMREIYEIELSTSAISIITNKVNQAAQEWQNRPLDPVYLIVWMDGIVFKVRDNGKIINKTVYLCVGLKQNGLKEVLGMWVGKSESSSFWMGVLTDLKARGVQDILITCTDNLNGFTDTIRSIFPQSSTQICVVHQIRNSCKYVVYKDKKEFTADMKNIYNAPNKEVAATELDNLEKKWGGKYPYAILSWRNNWDDLTVFFQFPLEIRKIIYTTNLIENLNGKTSSSVPTPPGKAITTSDSFNITSLRSLKLSVRKVTSTKSLARPRSSNLVGITPIIIEPLSLAALAIHSINPILAPPYTNVFLFCPIQTPNSRAFSKNTGSIFSDAEQKIAILSIILFSVSKYKYLHFLKNGNNFCCIFANRNLFEAKNNVIQYFHLA